MGWTPSGLWEFVILLLLWLSPVPTLDYPSRRRTIEADSDLETWLSIYLPPESYSPDRWIKF
jgi:hypothetical protein